MAVFESDDTDAPSRMREMFGPGQLDHSIRQAIHFGWMMLPPDRQTVDELEIQIRRIVDRALKDLREDAAAFGLK